MTPIEEFKAEVEKLAGKDSIVWDGLDKWGVFYLALLEIIERRFNQSKGGSE